MIDQNQAMDLLKSGLAASDADQTELVLIGEDLSLTRFAESRIHQNMYRSDTTVYVRAIKHSQTGMASTGDLSPDSVKRAVKQACEVANLMPGDEQFNSLPSQTTPEKIATFYKETAEFSPQERAEAVSEILKACEKNKMQAAGSYRITTEVLGVVNSLGLSQYNSGTKAELSMTATGDKDNSGWAIAYNRDTNLIKPEAFAQRAIDKAVRSVDSVALDSGSYTVILEPAAVGQLLLLLAFMGFGGKTMFEKRSFMSGKIGEQITGANITITEDPFNPAINGTPIDYEGVARKRVTLIDKGLAKGAVYNSYYAHLMGTESTGHALPPANSYGPYPKNMVMDGGTSTVEEMIKSTARGIYITHFWYLNFLNPTKTMVTGTTRDGTFLIENGVITKSVRNMRTNQSILDAFSNVEALSSTRELYPQYSVVMLVPTMKINKFDLEKTED